MALATIIKFPSLEEIKKFNYSHDISESYAHLAEVFHKPNVRCSVEIYCNANNECKGQDFRLEIEIDAVGYPVDWFKLTHLTWEDKEASAKFK
tara:strand:+ start:104 stop:382 length:279 start_codon:yes stop_codon:yes gene_type:complete